MKTGTILLALCMFTFKNSAQESRHFPFYVGTYTDTQSKGIYKYSLDTATGKLSETGLMANCVNPSFMAFNKDKDVLVVINEVDNHNGCGTVESYAIDEKGLSYINRSSSGGAHPCFVAVNDEGYVLTANYSGGNVGLLQLSAKGELSDLLDVEQHKASNGSTANPKAHSVWFSSMGFYSADLGTDQILFSLLDRENDVIKKEMTIKTSLPSGSGPRHMAFHQNQKWAYSINELNSTISLFAIGENGLLTLINTITTLPDDYKGANYTADILISADGKFLYGTNRGHNSIVIYSIDSLTGELSMLGHESTRGDWPRNFSLSPNGDYIVVANQRSNTITSFSRDRDNGFLRFCHSIEAPAPVCILFE